jgi:hypothetical protein
MTTQNPTTTSRLAVAFFAIFLFSTTALANHPVLVEGETDWDGDGLIGADEDNDKDNVFATINGAFDAAGFRGGVRVAVGDVNGDGVNLRFVATGSFPEQVILTAAMGNVTMEAAPGVHVVIDAIRDGDPANAERQSIPGIIVKTGADNRVILRNIGVRNWAYGMLVQGESHVVIENCRAEHNGNHNIRVMDTAVVAIHNSEINAAGIRGGSTNAPNPGNGITFENWSSGVVADTLVTGSFGAGIANKSNNSVRMVRTTTFDNKPDVEGRVAAN